MSVTSILALASIAASENRRVATIDIPGAYLNADLEPDKKILMRVNRLEAAILVNIDPRFEIGLLNNGDCIVKLNKALYGLVESAQLWNKHITNSLTDMGFVQNPHDLCVYNLRRNGNVLWLCTWTIYLSPRAMPTTLRTFMKDCAKFMVLWTFICWDDYGLF